MGQLVEGKWQVQEVNPKTIDGAFKRKPTSFRSQISSDPGSEFLPEPDRYHLYVAMACPWAHRSLIFRKLKGLENLITISVVQPFMGENGWQFNQRTHPDHLFEKNYLREIYVQADPKFTGRVTVPVLWDKKSRKIVNNESSEVIRILNSAFNGLNGNNLDFYPEEFRSEINSWNEKIYEPINNGVYKCGFARTQEAYDRSIGPLFKSLSEIDRHLADQKFLVGAQATEADWRLFPTLLRFDLVYHTHFKCNVKAIKDFPNLQSYLERLYDIPGISETFNPEETKAHYFQSHQSINPFSIVPAGPELDWLKRR